MRIEELDYNLPPDLIATQPAEPRDSARLMVINRRTGQIQHQLVRDLSSLVAQEGLLRPGDLMVFNQTRVLPARFTATRAATGGHIQGLYLRSPAAGQWEVMLESRGTLRPGERITFEQSASLELLQNLGGGAWTARLDSPLDTLTLLNRVGDTPLPPYIRHARRSRQQPEVLPSDAQRYNTVYARSPGSVAAPTAGLHFTQALLDELSARGLAREALTLHVGLGTFAPVRTAMVEDHPIHSEWIDIPPATIAALRETRARGGRIIPIGTTSVRALESLPDWVNQNTPIPPESFTTATQLFITPGCKFRFTDLLLTNFHLPRSTLLALVAALPGVGIDNLKRWYAAAIAEKYRFYSYGDAMLLA